MILSPFDTLHIDIETFSHTDIKKTSPYRYSEDPFFLILMAAWSINGGPVQVATCEQDIRNIPGLWDPTVRKVAHNAQFERVCFSRFVGMLPGDYLPPEEWHDTAAVAGELGYPQGLEELARWLGGEQKDSAGTRLINFFCKPNRKGLRNLPEDNPEEWAEFVEYCRQDVVTLIDVDQRLGDFPTETEREVFYADQHVNDQGILLDMELATLAFTAAADNKILHENEIRSLTGIKNPNSNPQMMEWLRGPGRLPIANLQAETVETALSRPNLQATARRVLELRQELALVASKKYTAALASVSPDDRLRGQFRFFGAHTGRWAGRGVQIHNLPRASLDGVTATEAAILDLKLGLGGDAFTLKALVRGMLLGPLTVVDYSAIEARVVAWLAGEQWVLDAFLMGRDIYVETAERMGGMTRYDGKIAVLALGYNGGVGAMRALGYGNGDGSPVEYVGPRDGKPVRGGTVGEERKRNRGSEYKTDAQIQKLVDRFRTANPNTVHLWKWMGDAFRIGGKVGDLLTVEVDGDTRAIVLPSGRAITYHRCKWSYEENRFGSKSLQASFADPKKNGMRARTYGGRLTENVTQAVARDVLAEALVRLEDRGYQPVGHIHDEILVQGEHPVEDVSRVMTEQPSWAAGLPLGGAGFTCFRYRKD